jgi:hypothetical protein
LRLFALLLAFGLAGCTQKLPVEAPAMSVEPKIAVTPDSVQAIFSLSCSKCHGGDFPLANQKLDTARDSWLALVNVRSIEDTTFFKVVPFDTLDSWLVMKLKNDPRIVGSQMPLGDPPLTQKKISIVTGWIASGAPAESIAAPAIIAQNR